MAQRLAVVHEGFKTKVAEEPGEEINHRGPGRRCHSSLADLVTIVGKTPSRGLECLHGAPCVTGYFHGYKLSSFNQTGRLWLQGVSRRKSAQTYVKKTSANVDLPCFLNNLFSSYIPTLFPLPPLLPLPLTFSPPHPIHFSEGKTSHGESQSLTHHFEAGPSPPHRI